MYKKELDNILRSGNLPNFMLIRGADEFSNEFYSSEILKFWQGRGASECEKLYYDEYDFASAINALEPSLFASSKALYIKTNKLIPTKQIKALVGICKANPGSFLLYELFEDGVRVSNDFVSAFEKNFVRFFKPSTPNEALSLLNQKCISLGLRASSNALLQIYKIHNENLSLCAGELEKFATLEIELNLANINALVFGLSEISFEDLFKKLLSSGGFRDEFFLYTTSGSYNETALVNALYREFYKLFKIYSYVKTHGSMNLNEILGYNPPFNVANELKAMSLRFKENDYKQIFIHLNETDFTLKTKMGLDKTIYLLARLLELRYILVR